MIFQILISIFVTSEISGYTLTELAFEYRPALDLHLISSEIHKENIIPITNSYYISYFDKSSSGRTTTNPNSNSSTTQPQIASRQNGKLLTDLNNYLPSAKPDSLTNAQNLIPVKSLLRAESISETVRIMSTISSSDLVTKSLTFPSVVAMWPEKVSSEQAANNILHSKEMQEVCRGFNIGSEAVIGFSTENGLLLYEVYNVNDVHVVKKLEKGLYDFHCTDNCPGVALRRSNLYGLKLNVSAMEDREPSDDLGFTVNDVGELMISDVGFSSRILFILRTYLNFTVQAMRATDWGRLITANGSWVGSVKDVRDGQANLGLAMTTMRPARAEQVSFLPAVDESIISAFFRNPDLSAVRDIFARPFKLDLWAAVFSTWIVLAVFMIMFSQIRKHYGLHLTGEQPEPDFTNDSFIWALATACQQGWDDHPVAGSLRTIFISGSFTGVVAYAGYSAAIVSTLSMRVDPIQNPEQLLTSSLKIGIREGFINEILQSNGTNDIMTAYQRKLKGTPSNAQFLNISTGYNYLLKHRYAFICPKDNMYDYLKVMTNDSEICQLKELQILKRGFPMGHFVARNSPFKEILRYMYVTVREPGVQSKLRFNYTYKRRCLEATDNTGNALGANDVFTAFMILCGGYFLSLVFLIIEKLIRVGKTFSYIE